MPTWGTITAIEQRQLAPRALNEECDKQGCSDEFNDTIHTRREERGRVGGVSDGFEDLWGVVSDRVLAGPLLECEAWGKDELAN